MGVSEGNASWGDRKMRCKGTAFFVFRQIICRFFPRAAASFDGERPRVNDAAK